MELQDYIDEIKLELTGGILELELSDEMIGKIVNKAFREVQRYIDTPEYITIPYVPCIDMKDFKCSTILHIFRTTSYDNGECESTGMNDPMYMQLWNTFSNGGTMYNLNQYMTNFMAYNTMLQIRNTTSTDLNYIYDANEQKLYINVAYDRPTNITIEYIPIYTNVNQITNDYWIDILQRLALALTKITLGRARTRFTQNNSLWQQDGETILAEGNEEVTQLREILRNNQISFFPVD